MKLFIDNENGKVNFVDEKNQFVGIDTNQICCEKFGYFIADEIINKIPKKDPPINENEIKNFIFVSGIPEIIKEEVGCSVLVFEFMSKDYPSNKKIKYLCLYNCHNGYYSHKIEIKTTL